MALIPPHTLASSTPLTSANLVVVSSWGFMSGLASMPRDSPFSSISAPSPLSSRKATPSVRTVFHSCPNMDGSACGGPGAQQQPQGLPSHSC